jgi:hypothetical protein
MKTILLIFFLIFACEARWYLEKYTQEVPTGKYYKLEINDEVLRLILSVDCSNKCDILILTDKNVQPWIDNQPFESIYKIQNIYETKFKSEILPSTEKKAIYVKNLVGSTLRVKVEYEAFVDPTRHQERFQTALVVSLAVLVFVVMAFFTLLMFYQKIMDFFFPYSKFLNKF